MGIKGKRKRTRKKESEGRSSIQAGLRCSNDESSTDQGVSFPMLQEVRVSPSLVLFYLRVINGHIVQSQPWG